VQKSGINYSDLELGNGFCNWVQVSGFCYKSLIVVINSSSSSVELVSDSALCMAGGASTDDRQFPATSTTTVL